jgi:hypothetical protein
VQPLAQGFVLMLREEGSLGSSLGFGGHQLDYGPSSAG